MKINFTDTQEMNLLKTIQEENTLRGALFIQAYWNESVNLKEILSEVLFTIQQHESIK